MTRSGWTIGAVMLALAAAGAAVNGAPTPRVDRFSPSGTVLGPEQISVHFATPMVPMGDPRLPAPITGTCSAGATGRWADVQTYVVDLPAALPGGKRCRYDLQPGLKDARGALVGGPRSFVFDTGGPVVRAALPYGGMIEEDQIFLLALAARPTPASVAAHAACLIEGVGEAVPLDILPDKPRDVVLGGAQGDYSIRRFLELAGWRKPIYSDDALPPRATILAAKCRRTLPPGGKLTILWGNGITTAEGLTTGAPYRLSYTVRPPFTARFECSRVNAASACSPLQAMQLAFSGNVPLAQAMAVRLVGPDGKALAPLPPKQRVATVGQVDWPAPFAARGNYRIVLPAQLRDDTGRPLANAARFPLAVATGDFPPLAKFAGSFGIIEANEGGVLPVTLRGIETPVAADGLTLAARDLPVASDAAVAAWLRRLEKAEYRTTVQEPIAGTKRTQTIETTRSQPLITPASGARSFRIDRDKDPRSFEVVGIPLKTKGFHVVEIASPALGKALLGHGGTRYVATGALVTNMAVHWQWGEGRSLAWVTRLADATPVAGALIAISDSCTGKLLWQGRTDSSGRALVGDVLPSPSSYGDCEYSDNHPLMVSARTADDYSFTLSTWGNGIQASDFNLSQGWGYDSRIVHTVFDRTLMRSGDTINMKLISRQRGDSGFGPPPPITARTLTIRHLASDTDFETPVTTAGSIGTARWTVPKTAPLGDYRVMLAEAEDKYPVAIGSFRVEEYRLPTIRASVSGPRQRLVAPRQVPVDLALTYLSGGAVAAAPVKLRTIVEPRTVEVPGFEGWSFNGEVVVPGIVALGSDGEEPDTSRAPLRAATQPVTLGPKGVARVLVDLAPVTVPSRLIAEMDYDDANGEVATTSGRIDLEPAAVRVGIRTDGWLAKSDDLRLQLVAVDLEGRPVRNQRVKVKLFSRETYSYRKRLIGGFYTYDNSRETKQIGKGCTGTSDSLGRLGCQIDAGVSGEVLVVAETTDSAGHTARASTSVWLAGDDDWWFGGDNGDRMDVVPENARVPGDGVARLQVRMPFRTATALVTVMRDGVIDSFVTTLSGKDPVVEVPMKPGYAPDVYVSVLAVRGRVAGWRLWLADLARRWDLPWLSRDAASPTALVDLAKPSYRLGIAKLTVGWDRHQLGVSVASDRPSYPVRSAAQAKVTVVPPKGRPLPGDAEIAFAAVDEALLQLQPNESWDLLAAMMAERPLGVSFATAQTQVVGKRHYGRKAVAAGGGGGAGAALVRRDFNPVLLWRARVPLDARGQALVPLRLNDSLSGFRLVAVATAGNDLFGTGMTTIRTTQDLQLLPGIPPYARDGDVYVATVLARNTTTAPMQVRVTGSAGTLRLPPLDLTIPAGGAQTAAWRVVAPAPGAVVWRIAAKAAGGQADQVEVTQTVTPAVPVETWQASLAQAGGPAIPMARPADALPGQGGVTVALSRSIGGNLPGVRAYMGAYPYDCIEQQLSRAVALGDRAGWDKAAAALPGYLDSDGLVRFLPVDWISGDDELTAYILRLSAASGWPLPENARAPMIRGLSGFVMGQIARSHANVLVVEKGSGQAVIANLSGDEPIRLVNAVSALAAFGAARPQMVEPLNVAPDSWPTVTVIDWIGLLEKLPVPGGAAKLAQAEAILRARLDVQGTTLRINRDDSPFQLLASPDSTAAQLLALAVRRPAWHGDAPRLARTLMLAQRRGHWDSTPANALGTLAIRDFQRAFEATPVTGTTQVSLGGQQRSFGWATPPAPQTLPWPAGQAALSVRHTGTGAPWVMTTARAAVPLKKPFSSGFVLGRQVTAVTQAVPGRWSRGDVMRVRLTIAARTPVEWVVINDPVPAGATILGGSLGGRSQMLAGNEGSGNSMPPTFVERRGDAVHAHYAQLSRDQVTYEYTLRLGSVGSFRLPPTRVEALYAPEMMAMLPNPVLAVAPAP